MTSDYEKWREEAIDCGGDFHKALQMLDVAMKELITLNKQLGFGAEALDQINAIARGDNGKD
jgi:hypothetical protein